MKEIVIKFEPFVFKQTVFIKDTEPGEVSQQLIPQKELTNFLSLQTEAEKIHLFGNRKFAEKIKEECMTKYKLQESKFYFNH